MHDHPLALTPQAGIDAGITVLYAVFAVRAFHAWQRDRAEGYDSTAGRFLVALAFVFGLCGISGYLIHGIGILAPHWRGTAEAVRLASSGFLLIATALMVGLEIKYSLLSRVNRAEGERDEYAVSATVGRAVLEATPSMAWGHTEDGTITFSEGAGLARVGWRPGQATGRNVFTDFGEETAYHAGATMRTGHSEWTNEYRATDGTPQRLFTNCARLDTPLPDGTVAVCIGLNVTEAIEEAERRVREQAQREHELAVIDARIAARRPFLSGEGEL